MMQQQQTDHLHNLPTSIINVKAQDSIQTICEEFGLCMRLSSYHE